MSRWLEETPADLCLILLVRALFAAGSSPGVRTPSKEAAANDPSLRRVLLSTPDVYGVINTRLICIAPHHVIQPSQRGAVAFHRRSIAFKEYIVLRANIFFCTSMVHLYGTFSMSTSYQ